jgi:hypothetical protein
MKCTNLLWSDLGVWESENSLLITHYSLLSPRYSLVFPPLCIVITHEHLVIQTIDFYRDWAEVG